MGGSGRAAESDWRALAGRDVTIWPDADEPGHKYAQAVADLATEAGAADVRIVRLPDSLPDGFDLADTLPDSMDVEAILKTRLVPSNEFVPVAEFMAMDTARADWLLDELLPADGLGLIVAKSKIGKSTLARCLAVAVADPHKGEFLNRKVTTGPVLHLALEERATTVQNHYRQIGTPAGLHVFCRPAIDYGEKTADRIKQLEAHIARYRPALVIVDTMIRFAPMANKELDDYPSVSAQLEPFLSLARRHKSCIVFIHHARKSGGEHGDDALGSTALTASMDTTISVKRDGAGRSYTATGRDGVETDAPISLKLSDDGWIDAAGTKAEATYKLTRGRVLTTIKLARPNWITADDVREAIKNEGGGRKATVLQALNELHEFSEIYRRGEGKKGNPYEYKAHAPKH